jgi:Long-chain acyl-CoA synthetases (AMP-forming)
MELYQNVPQRVFDLLPKYEKEFGPEKEIVAGKDNGEWKRYTIHETLEIVDNISYGMLKLGIKRGDNIVLVSRNCPEWNFIDWAIQQIGAVCIPLYPTISESDYKYNLKHSEAKMIFIYGNDIYRKIANILPEVKSLQGLYSIKPVEGFSLLSELMELGQQNVNPQLLKKTKASVLPSDLATIIYTSGTTGIPKGVMLTHTNLISNMMCLDALFPANKDTVLLSYLPLSHIYEREVIYSYMNMGAIVYYAESLGTIVENIGEVKPTVFASIPRLIEKIHYKTISKGQKMKGISKTIFFKALELGYRYDECGNNSCLYRIQQKIADKLVYSKLRSIFGGRLEFIILGGAAIQPRLAKLFSAMKIPIMEGYGLTETSPVVAVNSPISEKVKIGTVGHPVQNVEVRISDEGEILVKGPSVMKGYYKSPEQTAEMIDKDGWFHTGDKGLFDEQGFLKITGRLKEIFKTSMGKFISPTVIENMFLESPFINSIMVVGEGRKFAAALIVPNFEHLRSWCKIKMIPYSTDAEMVKSKVIIMRMRKEIDKYNKQLGDYERIMKFELLNADWSIDKGEMTGTMKMKRNAIQENHQHLIDKLYE